MEAFLWIAQGLLGAAFLGAGMMKLAKSHEQLKANPMMAWSNDFSGGFVKFIGTAETLGALGLVLPGITGIATTLTPLAAAGLVLLMAGAVSTHVRRGEVPMVLPPAILGALAGLIAYGRWVLEPLT